MEMNPKRNRFGGSWEFKSACNDLGYIHHWGWGKKTRQQETDVLAQYMPRAFSSRNPDGQTSVRWYLFTALFLKLYFFFRWQCATLKGMSSERNENTVYVHSPTSRSSIRTKKIRSEFEECTAFYVLYAITMNKSFQAPERI